jgi:tRNA A-37 threonylcarbamoyl transferase component Bud32
MEFLRKKIGVYYLTELIGQGGMSQVYLAVNPRTREKRAVKVLAKRATASPTSYARFVREVEIIRALSHPNIVKILDSGVLEDCYFYMMELMSGSLARRLARGRLPLNESVDLFAIICGAVAHAHDHAVIHRDLKPSNILLTAAGAPMVSDFGIAKAVDTPQTALTRSNEVLGTVAYLAPEQRFSTKGVDRRADVYALGAILYETLMGFPPLGKFPWPSETQPGFPSGLQTILERCLAINPDHRYMHAGQLCTDVKLHCGGKESLDPPAKSIERSNVKEKVRADIAPPLDRIEQWFQVLRLGTTRERLAIVREMVEQMEPREAKGILKMYAGEEDRVRWGLIKVFGELKVSAATPIIISELKNSYHRECAIEALGKIGAEEAFNPLRDFLAGNPESAMITLLPLARTGRQRSIRYIRPFLAHEMATLRQAAVRAIAAIENPECLNILKERLVREQDDRVRSSLNQSICSMESSIRAKDALRRGKSSVSSDDQTLQLR